MIESTSNFIEGLRKAYNAKKKEGISERDDRIVSFVLNNPQTTDPNGKVIPLQKQLHSGMRWEYLRLQNLRHPLKAIEWSKLVDWLVQHWGDIIRIVLMLVPFLI